MICLQRPVLSQRMAERLGILALTVGGFVFDCFPGYPPFILVAIDILIAILVISVDPANLGQEHILIQGALQFVGIPAPMRIVQPLSL